MQPGQERRSATKEKDIHAGTAVRHEKDSVMWTGFKLSLGIDNRYCMMRLTHGAAVEQADPVYVVSLLQ